jgi:predicted dehydrogenase
MLHGPMFAHHPATELVGLWGRNQAAAEEVAAGNGTTACSSIDELLDRCEAVSFAVPPDVQAELAPQAARAGKALLLEKPIALDLPAAERLVAAIDETGVPTQLVLSWRYTEGIRRFIADVQAADVIGGRGWFVSPALLAGPFMTPWRLEHGHILDLGPHVLDSLDAALGRITRVRASGDTAHWTGLLLEHETGVVSQATLSARAAPAGYGSGMQVHTTEGVIEVDAATAFGPQSAVTLVDEFVATAGGAAHPLDVHRGLHLQRLLDAALRDLGAR